MSRRKWFVGVKGTSRQAFASEHIPTASTTPEYAAVIGPFVTRRGAEYMARYGANNPHLQHVSDAERLAKAQ